MGIRLRINFVLPPTPTISGGPLAILEYANRFIDRGHDVSITTYPDDLWSGASPFPWFDFKGILHYKRARKRIQEVGNRSEETLRLVESQDYGRTAAALLSTFGLSGLQQIVLKTSGNGRAVTAFESLINDVLLWPHMMEAMPDCDLNIATYWGSVFPVFCSGKGRPVYFMQHYEEVFYPLSANSILQRLMARMSYEMPLYKVANSSWLQKEMERRFQQLVPFSNNGIELADFKPQPKKSATDAVIRVITYARGEEWKGFADAVATMSRIRARFGARVEWNVFGYRHPTLVEDNRFAPYRYHPKLSFTELNSLYATSDIALCPSWYESFPLPPLEAMASGTAVVTTRAGTEDYAFHQQNALVVGARQTDEMYEAICSLISNEALRDRLAANGRKTAETFSWDVAVEKREKILLAIHQGQTEYDVYKASKTGLLDELGTEFESAPLDVANVKPGLFWHRGEDLYFLFGGMKRHVEDEAVIPELLCRRFRYIEIDRLSIERTPTGPPIRSVSDLP